MQDVEAAIGLGFSMNSDFEDFRMIEVYKYLHGRHCQAIHQTRLVSTDPH